MGKTVTAYLVDGDPNGTLYAFISNKICQMYAVPRSALSYLTEQGVPEKPVFYILTGKDEAGRPQAYIGDTGNFREQIKDRTNKGSFWQKALVFVSKDADVSMTDVYVQYLAHKAITEAKAANTFILKGNKQVPKAPGLPEHERDPMDEFFEDVKLLTSFIGCNIFEISTPRTEHLFFVEGRDGCNAKGIYNSSAFTVLEGSIIAKTPTSAYSKTTNNDKRERLMRKYTAEEGSALKLTSDIRFGTPSAAAAFCLGRSSDGWIVWVDEGGESLDAVYRRQKEEAEPADKPCRASKRQR